MIMRSHHWETWVIYFYDFFNCKSVIFEFNLISKNKYVKF